MIEESASSCGGEAIGLGALTSSPLRELEDSHLNVGIRKRRCTPRANIHIDLYNPSSLRAANVTIMSRNRIFGGNLA